MDLDRTTLKRWMLLITFTVLLLTAVQRLDVVLGVCRSLLDILSPLLTGAAFAFIFNVPMSFLERKLFPPSPKRNGRRAKYVRPLSLLLTLVLIILVLMLLLLVIIPDLAASIVGLGATISDGINRAVQWAEEQFANNPQIIEFLQELSVDWEKLLNTVVDFLRNDVGDMISSTISSTISAARILVSGVADFFVSLIFSIYILLQKEKLGVQFRKALYALLPKNGADRVKEVFSLSYRVFSSFITGQCTEAVILGFMFFLAMSLFRMPYALLVSCLISITALIPIVGAFIGCGVGVFLLLLISPVQALTFLIMFLVLQQIEGNLIYPHVVGSSIGLPSIWVLAAVSIGGSLMGVTGMLLFIPLTSVLYSLFRTFIYRRLRERKLRIQ